MTDCAALDLEVSFRLPCLGLDGLRQRQDGLVLSRLVIGLENVSKHEAKPPQIPDTDPAGEEVREKESGATATHRLAF